MRLCIKYKHKREPLADMILKARTLDGDERIAQATRIIRQHGGLGGSMRKEFGTMLEPFEMTSFMWEALLSCIELWDGKNQASTDWRYRTMCLVRKEQKITFVGAVRVPTLAKKRFCKATDDTETLESVLECHDDSSLSDVEESQSTAPENYSAWRTIANRARQQRKARLKSDRFLQFEVAHFRFGNQLSLFG